MAYEQILYEKRGSVALITLNRPEKMNAWTGKMMQELFSAVSEANADGDVGAIVFTGAGRAFCAGADIGDVFKAQIDSKGEQRASQGAEAPGGGNWVQFVLDSEKPTIAAINGVAVGIGITLVLPCDIRIASDSARIGMFFVRMGLVPELASSHFLPQLVGSGRALEWCLTGRMIEAAEANQAGLVSEVLPGGELLERALALGETLAGQSPVAMKMIKQLLRENANESDVNTAMQREGKALAVAYASPEHHEAVAAFLEKRPANFRK